MTQAGRTPEIISQSTGKCVLFTKGTIKHHQYINGFFEFFI